MIAPRILLLGAQGQVGARLQQQLGNACIALGRKDCNFSELTQDAAREVIQRYAPQLIINAAGFTAVDAAEQQRALAMQVNAHAPGMLARAAGDIPFLHLSTDYVFDGTRGPYQVGDAPNPCNAYGESKLQGEREIMNAGARAYIFRLQWVYDTRGANFFLTMRKVLAERDAVRVVADQFGAPSAATDIAKALSQAIVKVQSGTLATGMYHLASAGHTSWHGFTCAIAQATGSHAVIEPILSHEYTTAAVRPRDTRLDCSALAAHGITMPHWRDGLKALMEEACM